VAVNESLAALAPWMDFCSRHLGRREAEYADWLIATFDRWDADGRPVWIRTFDSVLPTLHGGDSETEALGLNPASMTVIETGSSYQRADSLKTASRGSRPASGAWSSWAGRARNASRVASCGGGPLRPPVQL
jgi:uncharacterized protein